MINAEGVKIPEMNFDDLDNYEQNSEMYKEQYEKLKDNELV